MILRWLLYNRQLWEVENERFIHLRLLSVNTWLSLTVIKMMIWLKVVEKSSRWTLHCYCFVKLLFPRPKMNFHLTQTRSPKSALDEITTATELACELIHLHDNLALHLLMKIVWYGWKLLKLLNGPWIGIVLSGSKLIWLIWLVVLPWDLVSSLSPLGNNGSSWCKLILPLFMCRVPYS